MKALVERLRSADVPAVVEVLSEAFFDYPVMRFVIGAAGEQYAHRLETLVTFFTTARVVRDEVILGARVGNRLGGAALVSRPGRTYTGEDLGLLRDRVWDELGPEARARYGAFATACSPFDPDVPHLHLNMIGTRDFVRGTGVGRALIERVHELSVEDGRSEGVSLTTENPGNVPLYEHFGYQVVGRAEVAPGLATWGFFRRDRDDRLA